MSLLILIRFWHFRSRSENTYAIWNLNMRFDEWYKNNSTRKKNLKKILHTHREISSSFLGYFIRKSLFLIIWIQVPNSGFISNNFLCSWNMLIQIMNEFHVKASSVFHGPSPTWQFSHTFLLKSKNKLFRVFVFASLFWCHPIYFSDQTNLKPTKRVWSVFNAFDRFLMRLVGFVF